MVLHKHSYHFEREVELANAIFGLAPRNLIWICQKVRRLGNTMAITRQNASPLVSVDSRVEIGHHFACDAIVLDISIAVGETTPLLSELGGGHLDKPSALNEFLEFFCH